MVFQQTQEPCSAHYRSSEHPPLGDTGAYLPRNWLYKCLSFITCYNIMHSSWDRTSPSKYSQTSVSATTSAPPKKRNKHPLLPVSQYIRLLTEVHQARLLGLQVHSSHFGSRLARPAAGRVSGRVSFHAPPRQSRSARTKKSGRSSLGFLEAFIWTSM